MVALRRPGLCMSERGAAVGFGRKCYLRGTVLSDIVGVREMRMKRLRAIGFALALVVGAAGANADELSGTLRKIKETGVINIGYRDSSIPFSYLDDNQKPVGFAIDICMKIVDAVKKELKLDKLTTEFNPVTSS